MTDNNLDGDLVIKIESDSSEDVAVTKPKQARPKDGGEMRDRRPAEQAANTTSVASGKAPTAGPRCRNQFQQQLPER
ncbi:unnamed protein product [Plutella xylostella]|uniref:(diamondback moth) hypothetical protein n=1 Tax=Plutella xylostella TaxID=51655 RepID=A0A8S4FZI8_PLUXY|nr:unnamed protein product [Plutella xylostella]